MYNVNGLAVFNPNKAVGSGRHFETWNQMPFIKRYCWAELANIECNVRLLFQIFHLFWAYNSLPKMISHCWNFQLESLRKYELFQDTVGNIVSGSSNCDNHALLHYPIVPYFLFGIFFLVYTSRALWSIRRATEMSNTVNYIINGVEEIVRDVLDYLIDESGKPENENQEQQKVRLREGKKKFLYKFWS